MSEFADTIKKVDGKRHHVAKNSYGAAEYRDYYNKKRNKEIPRVVFVSILRDIFEVLISKYLLNFMDVTLPSKMGTLTIRKSNYVIVKNKYGDYKTNAPVDWNKTVELWEHDEEARVNKYKIRRDLSYNYKLLLKYKKGDFRNHNFYKFRVCRPLSQRVYKELTLNNKYKLWQNNMFQ